MKAMIIEQFGDPDTLTFAEVSTPLPQDDEVQIEVAFAGVNPVDWKICEGLLRDRLPHEFPIVLGWDASGIVTQVGRQVKQFKPGDVVYTYARKPIVQWGTYAQYLCCNAEFICLMPNSLTLQQAAAIPLSTLTAWQALTESIKLKPQESIFIHAGAGGVGSMAIQFAKYIGAKKIATTASPQNHDYVKSLGADIVIDYHAKELSKEIRKLVPEGFDAIFDTIGGKSLEASYVLLKRGGRLTSIVQGINPLIGTKYTILTDYLFVHPNGKQLALIADLLDSGKIVPPPITELPLQEASKALTMIKSGQKQGKLVLKVKKEL